MLVIIAFLFSAACVAGSFRRLGIAIAPTHLEPTTILEHLRGDLGTTRFGVVARAARREPRADWEAGVFEALADPSSARDALVNEQPFETDFRMQRFVRVPRVCASVCTSAAFLLAALSMRSSLADPAVFDETTRDHAVRDAVTRAVDIAAIGVCGTAFCLAILVRSRRAAKARLRDVERLVERLETLAPHPPHAPGTPRTPRTQSAQASTQRAAQ